MRLGPAELAAFRRDGFVVLRGVLPESSLSPVEAAYTRLVDAKASDWLDRGL